MTPRKLPEPKAWMPKDCPIQDCEARLRSLETLTQDLKDEVFGVEGQDSIKTRLRLIEESQKQILESLAEIKGGISAGSQNEKAARTRVRQTLITGLVSVLCCVVSAGAAVYVASMQHSEDALVQKVEKQVLQVLGTPDAAQGDN